MKQNIIRSLVTGLVSGVTQMLPVSAEAHRSLLGTLFHNQTGDAPGLLMIHIACLLVLMVHERRELARLTEARRLMRIPLKRREHHPALSSVNTIRMLGTCGVIAAVFSLISGGFQPVADNLLALSGMLTISGLLLLMPRLMRGGNKDSRNMPRLDGLLMALGMAASAIPGFSTMGGCLAVGMLRGVDRRFALRFSRLLMMVWLLVRIVVEAVAVLGSPVSPAVLICGGVAAAAAFVGGWLGLKIMDGCIQSGEVSVFCYYNWAMAIVCLALFLMV